MSQYCTPWSGIDADAGHAGQVGVAGGAGARVTVAVVVAAMSTVEVSVLVAWIGVTG